MFDCVKTGKQIALLRKRNGLTGEVYSKTNCSEDTFIHLAANNILSGYPVSLKTPLTQIYRLCKGCFDFVETRWTAAFRYILLL